MEGQLQAADDGQAWRRGTCDQPLQRRRGGAEGAAASPCSGVTDDGRRLGPHGQPLQWRCEGAEGVVASPCSGGAR
jgi:hypothetical protein